MGNNKGNNEIQIKLDAKRDARRRLLDALEEFDPAKDTEKIDKVKKTLQQINEEIKDIEETLKDTSINISTRIDIPDASIRTMDDSKINIKKEMQQLKNNIDSERKTWEEKLTKKQQEINNLKAKMNLRQAHLRAEYQFKRRELERVQEDLENKLRKETQPSVMFEEERERWQKRLNEKQQTVDDLKIEIAQNNSAFLKEISLLKEDTGRKISDLQEETRLIREQKIRDADQFRSKLTQRQMEITQLKQKLNIEGLRYKRKTEAQKKNHLFEIEALNETNQNEKERLLSEHERVRLELNHNISEMEHKIGTLHSDISVLEVSQKEAQAESRRQLSEQSEANTLRASESAKRIKHLEKNIIEIENLLADKSRDNEIERARLQQKIDTQTEQLRDASERSSQLESDLVRSRKNKERSDNEQNISIRSLSDELVQLKETLSAVRRSNEEISISAERQQKESDDKSREDTQAALQSQNILNDRVTAKESEIEKLKIEIQGMLQEKESQSIMYQEKLKDKDKIYGIEIQQKDKAIKKLEEQNTNLTSELSVHMTARDHENKSWARQVSEKEIRINELLQDIRKKQRNIDKLNVQADDIQKEHQDTKKLMSLQEEELKQRLSESEKRYLVATGGLTHQIEDLEQENERVIREKEDAVDKLGRYLDEVKKSAKTASEEYEAEKTELLQRLREYDTRYEAVKEELEKTRLELQQQTNSNETISARLQDMIENMDNERSAAAGKIVELQKTADRLERQAVKASSESAHAIEKIREEREYQKEKYNKYFLDSEKRINAYKEKIQGLDMSAKLEGEKYAEDIIKLKDELQLNLTKYNEEAAVRERLLDEAKSGFQSEKESILSELDKQKSNNEVLSARIKTLENRLADREKNNEYLLTELEQTQKNSQISISNLDKEKYDLNERYNAEKHELLNKIDISAQEIKHLKDTLESLRVELADKSVEFRDRVHSMEKSITKSKSGHILETARKDDEIARLKSLVQVLKTEKNRGLEEAETGFRQREQDLTAEKEKLMLDIDKIKTDFQIDLSNLENGKNEKIAGLKKTIEDLEIILKNTQRQKNSDHERMVSEKQEVVKVSASEIEHLKEELNKQKQYYGKIITELRDENKVKIWEVNKVRAELENLLKEFEERVAAQRLVWEEKLKNKDEQIKLIREELASAKSSLEERLEELKDANWRLQVQLEEDRKNWRKEYSDKDKELRILKTEKDKYEKVLMKELAQRESEWIKERASLQKNINRIEAQLESQIPQKEDIISRLQAELEKSNQKLKTEKDKYDIEFKDMKEDMKNRLDELEKLTKKQEEETLKYRTKLSEKESELITGKSKLENEISVLENKYNIKIGQLENELNNIKKDNASLEDKLLKKSKDLDYEKREKDDELEEVRRRLDKNLEEFKMKLKLDIEEHTESSVPGAVPDQPAQEKLQTAAQNKQSELSVADLKKQLKEFRKKSRTSIRVKEDEYLSTSSEEEKEKLKKEIETLEKERQSEEFSINSRIKEMKRQGK